MFTLHHRTCLAAATLLALSCTAFAQQSSPTSAGKPSLDVHPFVLEVDRNHDGCMNAQEWKAAGAPQSAYDALKDERGCVTEARMAATAPPDGVDANHDGKLSLAELIAFDKQRSARLKAGTNPLPAAAGEEAAGLPAMLTDAQVARGRRGITDGERALATWQIQNTMSRHEYYHAAIRNLEEIDTFWVSRQGRFAASATFSSPGWVMNGVETVRRAYGQQSHSDAEKALVAVNKVDPGIQVAPQNYGAGSEWVMHTSTTPVIEIAGDGKTAKGVWYSPGIGLMGHTANDRIGVTGSFFYEKYAGDFVKEDGVWKIWHLQMAYDFVPGLPQAMIDAITRELGDLGTAVVDSGREAGERSDAMPPGFSKPIYAYPSYTPRRPGILYPQLPQPYYTFSETFNYCNCDARSAKPYPQ